MGFEVSLLGFVWVMVALGVPFSWRKARGGLTYSWIGLELDRRQWALGLSQSRANWLIGFFSKLLHERHANMREFREALGRMVFVYGALSADRPFLAPLFAFLARRPQGERVPLPLYVVMTLKWLRTRLQERRVAPIARAPPWLGSIYRVDAKADGLPEEPLGERQEGRARRRQEMAPRLAITEQEALLPALRPRRGGARQPPPDEAHEEEGHRQKGEAHSERGSRRTEGTARRLEPQGM